MNDITQTNSTSNFFENIAAIIEQARRHVGRTTDLTMCITYFEIGRMITKEEQSGKIWAEYGRKLLSELFAFLNKRFKKGFSETNLRNARKFYQVYADSIQQTISSELEEYNQNQIRQTISAESDNINFPLFDKAKISQLYPFNLNCFSKYPAVSKLKLLLAHITRIGLCTLKKMESKNYTSCLKPKAQHR